MNPKFQKLLLKLATSAGFALVLGYVYKAELKLEDKIDEKYSETDTSETS